MMPDDEDPDLDELEDFGGNDLEPIAPPPSPRPSGGSYAAPPQPPSAEFVALSKRITDSPDRLEQGAIMFDILSASMASVLVDPSMSGADRRRELRTIAAAASKVFPLKEMHEAIAKIDAFNAQVERKAGAIGAELEARPSAKRAKVIPIRGSAVPDGRA
jgi:hypothetical protein